MSERIEEEARAQAWLRERGYATERPTWLVGDNPDFWASNASAVPSGLWVEVKSANKTGSLAVLDEHYEAFDEFSVPSGLHGYATFHLSHGTSRSSVERLLKRFSTEAPKYAGQKHTLTFVQQVGNKSDLRRLEIHADIPESLWVFGSEGAKLRVPHQGAKASVAPATLLFNSGESQAGRTYNFVEWSIDPECGLVVRLDPSDRPLESIVPMAGGHVATREKTIPALKKANSQIKAGCVHRDAAGLVVLVPQDWHVEPLMVQAACYGVLQVPIGGRDAEPVTGQMYHGHDGLFRSNKNTHLSAVVLLPREGSATFFPNPHALHPIADDAAIFEGATRAAVDLGDTTET